MRKKKTIFWCAWEVVRTSERHADQLIFPKCGVVGKNPLKIVKNSTKIRLKLRKIQQSFLKIAKI